MLTSTITSWSGRPADCNIASGINGSVGWYAVDAMLPLSDDAALVVGDVVELFVALNCIPVGLTRYCLIPIIWNK